MAIKLHQNDATEDDEQSNVALGCNINILQSP
jgi:hypothetical protein